MKTMLSLLRAGSSIGIADLYFNVGLRWSINQNEIN